MAPVLIVVLLSGVSSASASPAASMPCSNLSPFSKTYACLHCLHVSCSGAYTHSLVSCYLISRDSDGILHP